MTYQELKTYWNIEIIGGEHKRFTWRKVLKKLSQRKRYRFLFWFRVAQYLNSSPHSFFKKRARRISDQLSERYGLEISLGAVIGEGLFIPHAVGIVITKKAIIGKNFSVFQNVTIGQKNDASGPIIIGDNVTIGANSCIIGDSLKIGNNVTIAAAAFVNKDIPDNHVWITQHQSVVIEKKDSTQLISTRHSRNTTSSSR